MYKVDVFGPIWEVLFYVPCKRQQHVGFNNDNNGWLASG